MLLGRNLGVESASCAHCGLLFTGSGRFCCGGCESVYSFLQSNGLGHFYDLKAELPNHAIAPVSLQKKSFVELKESKLRSLDFYLEGIHCLGCLWILEKLPEILPGVKKAILDLGNSVLHVEIDARIDFQEVALTLQQLGYRPHPIEKSADEFQRNENRGILLRLGVAAACAGNIMLLSVSNYAGASGATANYFAWLSFFLVLPVLIYSATPLYQSAWGGLRSRSLSVDLPIVLAILAGFLTSVVSLVKGERDIYFDSLSMLVFLLLASRYLLKRMQQHHLSNAKLLDFLDGETVFRLRDGKKEEIPLSSLSVGDQVLVPFGGSLPCDGIVRSASACLDVALLSGESAPEELNHGASVYAGTKNIGPDFVLECTSTGRETRLGQILAQLTSVAISHTKMRGFADRTAKWFIGIVLSLSLLTILFFHSDISEGIRRALALVIVTCPCVLAFAVPLSLSLSNKLAAKRGILLKNPESLELLPKVEEIFLDKTGTVTEGNFSVISWMENAEFSLEVRDAVYSLEKHSRHPIARALVTNLESRAKILPVADFKEIVGEGVSGEIAGNTWMIRKSAQKNGNNLLDILRNHELVCRIALGDKTRANAHKLLKQLGGRKIFLLSGDRQSICERVANELNIPQQQVFFEKSPEQKADIIRVHPNALMVGDGANDALALKSATMGIAVHGSVELCLKNSEVFFSRPGLENLVEIFRIAALNRKVTIRNLVFSLLYNIFAGSLAITGIATPLWAAVLMPLSAFTVFLSTTISIRERVAP